MKINYPKNIGKAINRFRFKSRVWDAENLDYGRAVKMAVDIRVFLGMTPELALIKEGLDYCHIFSDNYDYALEEFKKLIFINW